MIYSVIVDISNSQVDKIFDYKSDKQFLLGQRVLVPFGNKRIEGFIVEKKDTTDCPPEKLKEILGSKDDFATISPEMLELCGFMQKKYHLRFIDVLRLCIPSEMRKDRVSALTKRQAKLKDGLNLDEVLGKLHKGAKKQRELLIFLSQNGETLTEQLNKQFGSQALKSLTDDGFVEVSTVTIRRSPQFLQAATQQKHTLTKKQQVVVDEILASGQGSFLLHGVTGSGKTEVYLNIIESIVGSGKNCIMLVPEISLTPNMMRIFRDRFSDNVALLHSGLSAGERFDEWLRLKKGEAKIAIGARSAIFAPIDNLGAIIIDEEHDGSYVSDFNPRYDTIEIAKFRRQQNNCILVLGSATPSLSSYQEAKSGGLKLLELPERINLRPLPEVEIVDMTEERRGGNRSLFSKLLLEKLTETVKKGNQAILFLNRRGFASFLMCGRCGYVARCSDCDVTLTVYRQDNMLKCHYCNKRFRMLTECPDCHEKSFRQGKIGTQQVVEYLNEILPNVKVLRMDSDTTQNKLSHDTILTAFAKKEAQILVGTQMVAKGHDFPSVTLVGILDGDQSLYHSNYLSTERTFQLLTQVAGRSGRDTEPGSVVLQTYTPTHYCLQLAAMQDYKSFFSREISLRETSKFPPFALIVRILYQGENEADCISQLAEHFAKISQLREANQEIFLYLDKMRCPLKRAERKFRFQILMKLENNNIDAILEDIYNVCDKKTQKKVQVFVELNPQSLT